MLGVWQYNHTKLVGWITTQVQDVGNRVSAIVDLFPSNDQRYVPTGENPADCASWGLLPLELITHSIWWTRPEWLRQSSDEWPHYSCFPVSIPEEKKEIILTTSSGQDEPLIPSKRYSDSKKLKCITAWIIKSTRNCRDVEREVPVLNTWVPLNC